jgi:hypothetical protein
MAEMRGTVSAAWEGEGAWRLRMRCFSRFSTGIGRSGRSRGWSVIYLGEQIQNAVRVRGVVLVTHRKRAEVWKNFGILENTQQAGILVEFKEVFSDVCVFYRSRWLSSHTSG